MNYKKAFTDPVTGKPYAIPDDLRRAAERICGAYGITGMCDPMYIANVIAQETGRGDGGSVFFEGPPRDEVFPHDDPGEDPPDRDSAFTGSHSGVAAAG